MQAETPLPRRSTSLLLMLFYPLLVWAYLCQTWLAAALLMLLIVLACLGPWRWSFTSSQFYRSADITAFLVLLLLLDVYWLQPVEQGIFVLLKWLPFLFAPVLLTQLFSDNGRVPLAALFFSLRKQASPPIDVVLPYCGLTMLSASAANVQNPSYFGLLVVWLLLLLWQQQTATGRRLLSLLWLLPLVALAYWAQFGLHQLQNVVEEKSVDWLSQWQSDPFKGETSIGDIGELKLSSKIEFRVKASQPLLLQQVSFDRYAGQQWSASQRQFFSHNPQLDNAPHQQLEILQGLYRETVLALPDGTLQIRGLENAYLQYTAAGAVKVTPTPGLAQFRVSYTGRRSGVTTLQDLKIPRQHLDWLNRLAQQLDLAQQTPAQAAQTIQAYFQREFRYSLYLGQQRDSDLALREFMLQRKAGHCEYFAVATVFLLRQAGIPARLANGYAVREYDAKNDWYVVRSRHAHAWAIAYIDGYWQPVDSTPSRWAELEAEQDGLGQQIADVCSDFVLRLKQTSLALISMGVIGLLLVYLLIRLYRMRYSLRAIKVVVTTDADFRAYPGLDSPLYRVEHKLFGTPQARQTDETTQQWLQRIDQPALADLYRLHYQLRFDQSGDRLLLQQRLELQVQQWEQQSRISQTKK